MKKKIVSLLLCVVLVFALGTIAFAADAAITAQPQSQTAAENEMVTFSVSVTGDVSYRWQYCPAGSDIWTNAGVDGCKSDTINVKATQYRDGQSYRCMVTCADGSVIYSDPAVLTLSKDAELKIIEQPESVTASVGDTVTLRVTASGSGLKYLWQYCDADGSAWNKCGLEGRDTDTLTVPVTKGRNGMSYHCVVTDASGATVTSDPAVLTVGESSAITITSQPSDVTAAAGDTVSFHVDASGADLTYLWQYCDANSSTWSKCGMNSRTSDTLLVPVTVYRDGMSYRCVITDGSGNVVESDAAKLTVADASVIEITAQPESASAVIGETVTFSVQASGDDLNYLWQYKDSDKSAWKKCGLDGRDSDTLTVPVTAARDGMSYHCIITDAAGNSVVSADAVLTAKEPVVSDDFTVTFVDFDGSVLATESVSAGGNAKLPANPSRSGYYFAGWAGTYQNVEADQTVTATYVSEDSKNIFVIDSVDVSKGSTATVYVHLLGDVELVDYDMEIAYDADAIEVTSVANRRMMASTVNHVDGAILFNYSDYENVYDQDDVISITFKVKDDTDATDAMFWFSNVKFVDRMDGSNFAEAEYSAIPGLVHIQ